MNFSLRTEGRLSTDYLLSALSYRHQQDKTGNIQLFSGEAILVVLTCVFVAIRGQCSPFGRKAGRWVDYSPLCSPSSFPVNTKAYFVCSGELGLAGPSEQTCTSSGWSGESHCTTNGDHLLGAQILAGNADDPLTNEVIGTVGYEELRTNPIIFTLDKIVTDVSIRVPGSGKMVTVCEVEVYGIPA